MPQTEDIIADQNDRFRKGDPKIEGRVLLTAALVSFAEEHGINQSKIIHTVQFFDTFTQDNDPYGHHDFGQFELAGQSCFWKIDLFDLTYEYGSEVPTDLSKTRRVLTIMLASDW